MWWIVAAVLALIVAAVLVGVVVRGRRRARLAALTPREAALANSRAILRSLNKETRRRQGRRPGNSFGDGDSSETGHASGWSGSDSGGGGSAGSD